MLDQLITNPTPIDECLGTMESKRGEPAATPKTCPVNQNKTPDPRLHSRPRDVQLSRRQQVSWL